MTAGTAVTTVDPTAPKEVQAVFAQGQLGMATSLPLGTIDEKIAAANTRAGEAKAFADLLGKSFTILDVLIHPVDLVVDDDTGATGTFPRTVLVTEEYGNVAAVSNGLVRELGTLATLFGPAQGWRAQGGVRVEAKQLKTRRGFRTYALMPVVAAGKTAGKR